MSLTVKRKKELCREILRCAAISDREGMQKAQQELEALEFKGLTA